MIIKAIKTRKFRPPKDNLWELLLSNLPQLKENTIVAVASKIVSINEGRCIPFDKVANKDELVISEAEKYLPRNLVPGEWVMHTLKHNTFLPSAGIDESNALGHYILWPKDPDKSAKEIHKFLKNKFGLKNLGVIITDSHSVPLRRGVIGLALSFYGFWPLKDYRGELDIFGRELVYSQTNLPDGLAAAAVLAMGEGGEQTPLALVTDVPVVKFGTPRPSSKKFSSFKVKPQEDLYRPFFKALPWKKGRGGK